MTSAPKVRVNNYTKNKNIPIDVLSKIFIIFEFFIGLNRIDVFCIKRVIFKKLSCLYSVSIIGLVCYYIFYSKGNPASKSMKLTQYVIYTIFGFATRKKLEQFYKELKNFDKEIGTTPKITPGCLKNVLQTAFIVAFALVAIHGEGLIQCAVLYMIHVLENQYYGHLLLLLIQRLRLINFCVKSSLYNTKMDKLTELENYPENDHEIKMIKVMDFYCIIVNAYDLLKGAIKCQVKIIHRFLMVLINLHTFH